MEIKQLLYFITLVNEGNITAAAKKLHIAQPALSNHLKGLEEEVGIKLFNRGARNITLTQAGEILFNKANNIIELKNSIKKELEDTKIGIKGTLKIGIISAIEADMLEKYFLRFHKKYEKIKYEIYEGITPEIINLLKAGVIEIGIVRTPFESTGLNTIYMKSEPMIAAYNTDYDLDSLQNTISIRELEKKPLIIYRRFKDVVLTAFQREEINPDILCINDDSRTSLLWANAGLGIAIVPMSSKGLVMANNLKYKIIDNQALFTQNAVITLEGGDLSTIAKNFLKETNILT
ncbi:LysR family transcriptional regulator [Clostridium tunisiense]|uniref:LysR family transcriptional regulator n=1 Tax=Clostridium tunisiense TaxID=219748 RepID=UPI00031E88C2|nr:LysR family transcriptional regulator [Clostridium tunisiense]